MEQFVGHFYPQVNKEALIVDDRWNGGGFTDQIVLKRLRRILIGMATNREGAFDGGYITVPEGSLYGLASERVIENHGVDPDIAVETDPGRLNLLRKLRAHPGGPPPPPPHLPAYPPQGQVPPPSLP